MYVVGIGVDEADGNRLDTFCKEHGRGLAHRCLVERRHDAAIGGDTLGSLEPPTPRHQRLGLAPGHIEHAGRADATDLQHIAKAARRQQAGPRAGLLQDGVGRYGGAMHHLDDVAGVEPCLRQDRRDAHRDAFARIGGRGRGLIHVDAAIGQREHDIGKGAADIHADTRDTTQFRTPIVGTFAPTATHGRPPGPNIAKKKPSPE